MASMDELTAIRGWIKARGPTEASRLTGITRRALQYIQKGKVKPSYSSMIVLRAALEVDSASSKWRQR